MNSCLWFFSLVVSGVLVFFLVGVGEGEGARGWRNSPRETYNKHWAIRTFGDGSSQCMGYRTRGTKKLKLFAHLHIIFSRMLIGSACSDI